MPIPMLTTRTPTFLSTLPVRGATKKSYVRENRGEISIHAPREGSDRGCLRGPQPAQISIHAPREGSDVLFFCPKEG